MQEIALKTKTISKFKMGALLLSTLLTLQVINPIKASASTINSFKEKNITINGDNISYSVNKKENKKGTIIFIHGALVDKETMLPLASQFNDYQTVLLDLPGHGDSNCEAKETIDEYSNTLEQFIKELESKGEISDNITIVGWSMGGSVALNTALKNIPEVKNVVLISSASEWNIPEVPREYFNLTGMISMLFTDSTSEDAKNNILNNINKYAASTDTCMQDFQTANSFNITDKLNNINVPVLILSGDKDILAPTEIQNKMNSLLQNSKIKIFEGRGHMLVMESPDLIANNIKNFLK